MQELQKKLLKDGEYFSNFSQIIFKGFSATYPQNKETSKFLEKGWVQQKLRK